MKKKVNKNINSQLNTITLSTNNITLPTNNITLPTNNITLPTNNIPIKIPKNIFRTFKYDFSEELKKSWITLNPEYKYYFYDNDACEKLIKNNFDNDVYITYMTLNAGATKADLWRCCVLYLYGGVYVDIDCKCLVNLDGVLLDNDFVIPIDAYSSNKFFFNAFIASTPRNNILLHQINRIIDTVKNKLYIGNIFLISGPESFGRSISNLLNYNTSYSSSIYTAPIKKYKRFFIGKNKENNKDLSNIKNINNILLYNTFDNSFKIDNFIVSKNNENENIGWDIDLSVAINNSSDLTFIEKFYFGKYNYTIDYFVQDSTIITLSHDEYDKLNNNIQNIEIHFSYNNIITDLFDYNILSYDSNNLTIEIKKRNLTIPNLNNIQISIYYKSLEFDLPKYDEISVISYDSLEYYMSNNQIILDIKSQLSYSHDILPNNKLKITIDKYNFYLPSYTIINCDLQGSNILNDQKINFLDHVVSKTPRGRITYDAIHFNNNCIISTQLEQNEKNNIVKHYFSVKCYTDFYPSHKNNIAVLCISKELFYFIGCIAQYNKNIDYFIDVTNNNCEKIEKLYFIKLLDMNTYNYENYDKIIVLDNDYLKYNNMKKIIYFNNNYNNSLNFDKIININKFSSYKYNYIEPLFIYTPKEIKENILKEELQINIFYNGDKYINAQIENILLNTSNLYNISIFHAVDIKNILSNDKIKFINISEDLSNIDNYLNKTHYLIESDSTTNYNKLIYKALGSGCQLLINKIKLLSTNITSSLLIDNITVLNNTIDLNKIYDDINNIILTNNKVFDIIFDKNIDLL